MNMYLPGCRRQGGAQGLSSRSQGVRGLQRFRRCRCVLVPAQVLPSNLQHSRQKAAFFCPPAAAAAPPPPPPHLDALGGHAEHGGLRHGADGGLSQAGLGVGAGVCGQGVAGGERAWCGGSGRQADGQVCGRGGSSGTERQWPLTGGRAGQPQVVDAAGPPEPQIIALADGQGAVALREGGRGGRGVLLSAAAHRRAGGAPPARGQATRASIHPGQMGAGLAAGFATVADRPACLQTCLPAPAGLLDREGEGIGATTWSARSPSRRG